MLVNRPLFLRPINGVCWQPLVGVRGEDDQRHVGHWSCATHLVAHAVTDFASLGGLVYLGVS